MKHFLILGDAMDIHVHYVVWALGMAGHATKVLNSGHENCPTQTTLCIDDSLDAFTSPDWQDAEAVWCRRLSRPINLREKDVEDEFAIQEDMGFTKWLFQMQEGHPVRWVNFPSHAQAAENKLVQLKLAKHSGLRIPRTLVTAQPGRFRTFLEAEGAIVAKVLTSHRWELESGDSMLPFATVINAKLGAEISDEDIAKCVTMYQQRINKVADVRVVIMGQDVFAFKIIQMGEQHFDFRLGFLSKNHLKFELMPVPDPLVAKILNFMAAMKVNFASADFALTPDGDLVFLDLNPSGQWSFIEYASPETRVGQRFCSFFVNGRINPDLLGAFSSFSEYQETPEAKALDKTLRNYFDQP